jgi:hypothetical protein
LVRSTLLCPLFPINKIDIVEQQVCSAQASRVGERVLAIADSQTNIERSTLNSVLLSWTLSVER